MWCIGEDSNVIKKKGERNGISSLVNDGERVEFNEFIEGLELINIPSKGNNFTWFNLSGKPMSRLDGFLLLEELVIKWKVDGQMVGERDFSNHCLIWIKGNSNNWVLKPFKSFNCWIQHPKFLYFVENVWK